MFQVVTTVLSAPSSADLTDLASARDELSIPAADTTFDAFLRRAISQASAAISNYCNRVFQVLTLQDLAQVEADPYRLRILDGTVLQLARWPLVEVLSVTRADSTPTALVEGTDYRADMARGQLIALNSVGAARSWPPFTVTTQYRAGFTKSVYGEAKTVPGSPFAVSVANAAAFAVDRGVTTAAGVALTKVATAPAQGQYSVSAGVYTFNAADTGLAVLISYDYAAVPDDVVMATLRLVVMRFRARGRDPMLRTQGESIGQQTYWVGPMPGQDGALPPEIAGLLDSYRVPVVT